jgi:hypothetical protein
VGVVLVDAAVAKMLDVPRFLGALRSYRLLPAQPVSLAAVTVPWTELGVAGLILSAR